MDSDRVNPVLKSERKWFKSLNGLNLPENLANFAQGIILNDQTFAEGNCYYEPTNSAFSKIILSGAIATKGHFVENRHPIMCIHSGTF